MLLLAACNLSVTIDGDQDEEGSRNLVTEVWEVGDFDRIDISNAVRADVTMGSPTRVEVEFDDNLLDDLRVRVSGKTLFLSCRDCQPSRDAIIHIATPKLERIVASGAGEVVASAIRVDSLHVELSGAGRFQGMGDADRLIVDASGASRVLARDLVVRELDIRLSGASQADVQVTDQVTGELSGASRLKLTGDHSPARRVSTSGTSSIEP